MEDLNFQLILVIAFLIIGAIRWVAENMLAKKRPPEREHWEEYDYEGRVDYATPPKKSAGSLDELYDEARREILERQNRQLPEPEVIQQKLNSYRSTPVPAPAPPPLPPKVQKTVVAPREDPAETPYQLPQVTQPKLTAEEKNALEAFEKRGDSGVTSAETERPPSRVRELLKSPQAARDAIVLAEVLGKPRGAS